MKTIEEKAKAYDEALERAKESLDKFKDKTVHWDIVRLELGDIFPELKETEDERIRKELIEFLKLPHSQFVGNREHEKWIAWLEKQGEPNPYSGISFAYNGHTWGMCARDYGVDIIIDKHIIQHFNIANIEERSEQKPINDTNEEIMEAVKNTSVLDKIEPKFNVGDWVSNGDYTWKIVEVKPLDYILQAQNGNIIGDTISYVDEQFHSFTIQDAKDGDVLVEDSCIFIIQKLGDNSTAAKTYCTLYDDGDFDNGSILYFDVDSTYPATKEQRDQLEKAMADAGYKWNQEERKLEKI